MRIFLVRHGQSTANVDVTVHKHLPDHAIPLSDLGRKQATNAGIFLREYFKNHPIELSQTQSNVLRIWQSPYTRTRQTAQCIMPHLQLVPFKNDYTGPGTMGIDLREHDNLCEQHFGLFDGIFNDETHQLLEAKYPNEFEHYMRHVKHNGKYWARFPQGESRFDLAIRVHEAFGTFHRDCEKHGVRTIIVVCHGLVLRAFVKQWLHLPFEWMDNEPNPGNCAIRLLEDGEDKGYIYYPTKIIPEAPKYGIEGKLETPV